MPASGGEALLVVDMQNGFCLPAGSHPQIGLGLAGVEQAVERAATAVRDARERSLPIVFTRHLYRSGRADEGSNLPRAADVRALDGLLQGTWDAEIVDGLGWSPADLTVDKCRFDAFLWTSLDPLLRGLGVTDLLVCGVLTNVCVESTVRSAFMRDYRVTVLADACAGATAELHDIGIRVMEACGFAAVARVTATGGTEIERANT